MNDEQHGPQQTSVVNPGACKGQAIPAYYNTHTVLLI